MLHVFRNLLRNKNLTTPIIHALGSGIIFGGGEVLLESIGVNDNFYRTQKESENIQIATGISGFVTGLASGFVAGRVLTKAYGANLVRIPSGQDLPGFAKFVLTSQAMVNVGVQRTYSADRVRCSLANKIDSTKKKFKI